MGKESAEDKKLRSEEARCPRGRRRRCRRQSGVRGTKAARAQIARGPAEVTPGPEFRFYTIITVHA